MFLDVGRRAQSTGNFSDNFARGGLACRPWGIAKGAILAFPQCALALFGNKRTELQAEPLEIDEHDIVPEAPSQIEQLEPAQLAIWVSSAPDPQRTALALFYLDEFDYLEILDLAELKLNELSRLLTLGRRQFQAWLDAMLPKKLNV